MKRTIVGLAAAALILISSGIAWSRETPQASCDLMIDVSQSMKGFQIAPDQPKLPSLIPLLAALRQLCGSSYVFGDDPIGRLRPLPLEAPIRFEDRTTLIGPNLKLWANNPASGPFLLLLTDNIADNGRLNRTDPTRQFYDVLQSADSPFSHVTIVTLRAGFRDRLFDLARTPAPGERATAKPRAPTAYAGPRALSLYILGKQTQYTETGYQTLRQQVDAILLRTSRHPVDAGEQDDDAAYAVFDVKPFGKETFRVESPAAQIELPDEPEAVSGALQQCSAQARFDEATHTFVLDDQPMDQECELRVRLTARFSARWCLIDTSLKARFALRADDPDMEKQSELILPVNPDQATLCTDQKAVSTHLKLNAFRFATNVPFWERLKRAFQTSFPAEGVLVVMGTVKPRDVVLVKSVADAWDYANASDIANPDPRIQRRIYRLGGMMQEVIPPAELVDHELVRYNVRVKVLYAQAPVIVSIVLSVLVALLLAVLAPLMLRPARYVIEGGDSDADVVLGIFGSATVRSNRWHVTVTNILLGLFVTSNAKIIRGRFLSRSGGAIDVSPGGQSPSGRSRPWFGRGQADRESSFDADADDQDRNPGYGGDNDEIGFTVRAVRQPKSASLPSADGW